METVNQKWYLPGNLSHIWDNPPQGLSEARRGWRFFWTGAHPPRGHPFVGGSVHHRSDK